jgi:hypothetical protein
MQFTNYTDFRIKALRLIDGDDVGTSFSMDSLDLMIGMAENRVYRDLRASTMLEPLSQAVTANVAALPSDLIELKEAYFSGERPLEIVPLDRLRRLVEDSVGAGVARYAAQDGDTLVFWPQVTGTVIGKYYKRPTAMADETVWANQTTLARYPELFLFATLAESAPFIGEDARIPVWETKYAQALGAAKHDERVRAYGGGRLRIRTS